MRSSGVRARGRVGRRFDCLVAEPDRGAVDHLQQQSRPAGQRALLRQTDETLAQAVANWRPRVTLSVEYNKIEQDSLSGPRAPTYYILNGRITTLSVTQPIFRGGKTVADTKAAQANIQAQRALAGRHRAERAAAAVDLLRRSGADIGIVDARRNNVRVLVQQLDATRERFRVGELTITDVSQAEARLEQAKADLVQAEAQVRIAEAAFQRAIGAAAGAGWARCR